jgi:arylformamidase
MNMTNAGRQFLGAIILAAVLVAGASFAQEPSTTQATVAEALTKAGITRHADIRYDTIPGVDAERQSLDVFTGPSLRKAPVILFVHGGSWQRGSKAAVASKPLAFVPAGFVTVAANYRFRPNVEIGDMARDIATATAWVRQNISRCGGDPDRIILMGHSAGAHLVAVVGTDTRFLSDAGVPRASIIGVVPLDTGPYDVAKQMGNGGKDAGLGAQYGTMIQMVFGSDKAKWLEVSPSDHVKAGLPPFLVVSSDKRSDAKAQAIPFVEKLKASGVAAEWYEAKGLDHGGVNADVGRGDTPLTAKVLEFLRRIAKG